MAERLVGDRPETPLGRHDHLDFCRADERPTEPATDAKTVLDDLIER
jgi:hypothetical protein